MLSQLLIYNEGLFRSELRAYVFGDRPKSYTDNDVRDIVKIFSKYGIKLFHLALQFDTEIRITDLATMEISEHSVVLNKQDPIKELSDEEKAYIDNTLALPPTEISTNIECLAKMLDMRKGNLGKTLKYNFIKNVDFKDMKSQGKKTGVGRGNNTMREIFVTSGCFSALCMRSSAERATLIRSYLAKKIVV